MGGKQISDEELEYLIRKELINMVNNPKIPADIKTQATGMFIAQYILTEESAKE
jgi:hypothetical protein